jgi:formate dehydrogenase major subunit
MGSALFSYVITTYRLTEHHTAGGMSRSVPYLPELQMFCAVAPELATERGLEHGGWATILTAQAAIERSSIALDPNVHVQETKAMSGDIRPRHRPRGPHCSELLDEYIRRAGVRGLIGMEVRGGE